jgi:Rap1a immunity proteins
MKGITAIIVLVLGASLSSPALAEDDQTTGNYWLHECKKDPKQLAQSSGSFQYGWCFGVVYGLSIHPLICAPSQVPVVQEMDVVLKYLDAHPETRHRSFRLLALEALKRGLPLR